MTRHCPTRQVAGAGDGFTVRLVRHRQTKETETDRLHLRDTAPVLDPTSPASSHGRESGKLYFIGGKTCEGRVLTKTINSQQKI